MKAYKFFLAPLAIFAIAACNDIKEIVPESGTMLDSQVKETNAAIPQRAEASFNGMFSSIGEPIQLRSTPDDQAFLTILFCNDLEGADATIADNDYNWFSVCGEYSSRNADYRNPSLRYTHPYNMIAKVNTFVSGFSQEVSDTASLNMIAQAKCLRAYSYLLLAPSFQFGYMQDSTAVSVPLVTEATVDFTQNPRASLATIYGQVLTDLNAAIEILTRPEIKAMQRKSKQYIDANVAYGLRARANLAMGHYGAAYADAVKAAEGYTPATIAQLSDASVANRVNFKDIKEPNWIWGAVVTKEQAANYKYATTSAWLRSFSGWGYSAACACYTCINKLLFDKIQSGDVRKGWWVDENLESPLLKGWAWPGCSDVVYAEVDDQKMVFDPYTNIKFGCRTIGTTLNDEDMPLMRVEEMILIQAECQARLGNTADAAQILTNFVATYREPNYNVAERGLPLLDEIWFQRRVELWGEGFFVPDQRRLNKPIVRTHGVGTTNVSDAFAFNLKADDGYLLMRFPAGEMNTNFGIVDNTDGKIPVKNQNPTLRDGVTD